MQTCWNGQGAAKCGSILHSPLLAELAALEIVLQDACAISESVPACSSETAAGLLQADGATELCSSSLEVEAADGWQSDCSSGVSDDEGSARSGSVSTWFRSWSLWCSRALRCG